MKKLFRNFTFLFVLLAQLGVFNSDDGQISSEENSKFSEVADQAVVKAHHQNCVGILCHHHARSSACQQLLDPQQKSKPVLAVLSLSVLDLSMYRSVFTSLFLESEVYRPPIA